VCLLCAGPLPPPLSAPLPPALHPNPSACPPARLPAHLLPQIQPHDAFGQQMLLNLESRGCALLGIEGGAGWRQ
jgi:hypothetical protein